MTLTDRHAKPHRKAVGADHRMYAIATDALKSRVTLTFSGIMDQDPEAFFADLTSAVRTARDPIGRWDFLLDLSATTVMPQDRAKNTERVYQWCAVNGMRKCAALVSLVTQRMQIKRVTQRDQNIEYFDSMDSALAWLECENG